MIKWAGGNGKTGRWVYVGGWEEWAATVSGTLGCQWQLSYDKAKNCMAVALPSMDSMTGGIFHASPVADSGAPAVSPIPPPPTRREVLCLGLICPRPMALS